MMHSSYTDRYSSDEHFDGDWDDIVSPNEYNDYIDRVQYAKSNGYKRPSLYVPRQQRRMSILSEY
jgi:hypothetical protein